jgi:3'(2'), 5'-bisphosphate nucleotidase
VTNNLEQGILPIVTSCAHLLRGYFSKREALPQAEIKSDTSPVTLADRAANTYIVEELSRTFPGVPVISEEGSMPTFEQRSHWNELFLVDPLDGTKEFIRGSPDFAINIAFVQSGIPTWGILCAPQHEIMVWGGPTHSCFSQTLEGTNRRPLEEQKPLWENGLRAVLSQGHRSPWESPLSKALPLTQMERFGSSYKFVRLAMGLADVFFRKTPTSEWDTAAGQAVLAGLGFELRNFEGQLFRYNRRNLLNGGFVCCHQSIMERCLTNIQLHNQP